MRDYDASLILIYQYGILAATREENCIDHEDADNRFHENRTHYEALCNKVPRAVRKVWALAVIDRQPDKKIFHRLFGSDMAHLTKGYRGASWMPKDAYIPTLRKKMPEALQKICVEAEELRDAQRAVEKL